MMHAGLDRLEEILGTKNNTYQKWQRGSHWLGAITFIEDCDLYAYVTASNVKILALIQREDVIDLNKPKENDIKLLLVRQFKDEQFLFLLIT